MVYLWGRILYAPWGACAHVASIPWMGGGGGGGGLVHKLSSIPWGGLCIYCPLYPGGACAYTVLYTLGGLVHILSSIPWGGLCIYTVLYTLGGGLCIYCPLYPGGACAYTVLYTLGGSRYTLGGMCTHVLCTPPFDGCGQWTHTCMHKLSFPLQPDRVYQLIYL